MLCAAHWPAARCTNRSLLLRGPKAQQPGAQCTALCPLLPLPRPASLPQHTHARTKRAPASMMRCTRSRVMSSSRSRMRSSSRGSLTSTCGCQRVGGLIISRIYYRGLAVASAGRSPAPAAVQAGQGSGQGARQLRENKCSARRWRVWGAGGAALRWAAARAQCCPHTLLCTQQKNTAAAHTHVPRPLPESQRPPRLTCTPMCMRAFCRSMSRHATRAFFTTLGMPCGRGHHNSKARQVREARPEWQVNELR